MFTCTASSLKGISETNNNKKNTSIMKCGRCTWINLPEFLDSADKQNLLSQYIAQFLWGKTNKQIQQQSRQKILNSYEFLFINAVNSTRNSCLLLEQFQGFFGKLWSIGAININPDHILGTQNSVTLI